MVYVQKILEGRLKMRLCVIIPTFNEAKAIPLLIKQVRSLGFDLLVIDDGSTDNTARLAESNGAVVLRNTKNSGKGASLIKGFDYALRNDFDAAIAMDGDGQHDPNDIANFISAADNSTAQILIGNRMLAVKTMPFIRFATNRLMSWIISNIIHQNVPDTQCGFRLIKKEALRKIKLQSVNYEIETELLIKAARAGFKIDSVAIKTIYKGQKSRINPYIDTLRFIKFIISSLWNTQN